MITAAIVLWSLTVLAWAVAVFWAIRDIDGPLWVPWVVVVVGWCLFFVGLPLWVAGFTA